MGKILWIGGTSCLARSCFEELFNDDDDDDDDDVVVDNDKRENNNDEMNGDYCSIDNNRSSSSNNTSRRPRRRRQQQQQSEILHDPRNSNGNFDGDNNDSGLITERRKPARVKFSSLVSNYTKDDFVAIGHEPPVGWELPHYVPFVYLDLMNWNSVNTLWDRVASAVAAAADNDVKTSPSPRMDGTSKDQQNVTTTAAAATAATTSQTKSLKIDAIILSARLSLVWGGPSHVPLAAHLDRLLRAAITTHGCRSVLHVSSIAVADHTRDQRMWSEDHPLPSLVGSHGKNGYDSFKRLSEEIVTATCRESRCRQNNTDTNATTATTTTTDVPVKFTNLRLGGLFSNGSRCIQCNALRLQLHAGVYSFNSIDFNSGRNVGVAILLLLDVMLKDSPRRQKTNPDPIAGSDTTAAAAADAIRSRSGGRSDGTGIVDGTDGNLAPVYYYTRPTFSKPALYRRHVSDWRVANGVKHGIWIPRWFADGLIGIFRGIVFLTSLMMGREHPCVRVLVSLDYLLRVGRTEHTFDNSRFRADFGGILSKHEESIPDAFERIVKTRNVR